MVYNVEQIIKPSMRWAMSTFELLCRKILDLRRTIYSLHPYMFIYTLAQRDKNVASILQVSFLNIMQRVAWIFNPPMNFCSRQAAFFIRKLIYKSVHRTEVAAGDNRFPVLVPSTPRWTDINSIDRFVWRLSTMWPYCIHYCIRCIYRCP